MTGLVVIHWKAEEVPERLERLKAAGHSAEAWDPRLPGAMGRYRSHPPAAIIIDLTRLPSHGRACASALRQQTAYRHVPLVFAGGAPEKVAETRNVVPDATYAAWEEIDGAIRRAVSLPAAEPVVPEELVCRPSTPLARKLMIGRGAIVALRGAPAGFERQLEPLPPGVDVRRSSRGKPDVVLLFVRRKAELSAALNGICSASGAGSRMWVVWPKRASGHRSDLTPVEIREVLAGGGLVDYKICSVDATWSGMLFGRSRKKSE